MKTALLFLALLIAAPAPAEDAGVLAALFSEGARLRRTREGYVVSDLHGPQATLRRTRDGYVLVDRYGASRTIRRTAEGFVVAPGAPGRAR